MKPYIRKTCPPVCGEEGFYTRTLTFRGLIQGVGYRPFVRREALARGIRGDVRNIGGGVIVHAFGTKEALDDLFECLLSSAPEGTVYLDYDVSSDRPISQSECPADFIIGESAAGSLLPMVAPDLAPCTACAEEMSDPASRRWRYPFQSCAVCGPRYSIQSALPYDRVETSMRDFPLCADCRAEYDRPQDRRSYAQTIACKVCGPRLTFHPADSCKPPIKGDAAALDAAIDALCRGEIVAVKNNGGFHLACAAQNRDAVRRLRALKGREEKPFALLFPDLSAVEAVAEVSDAEQKLLTSPARPIVLLRSKGNPFPSEVAGESIWIGAMLPSTPLQILLAEAGVLVMTSANLSGEPLYTDSIPLASWLAGRAAILDHDRPIVTMQDDSLLFVEKESGTPCFLRRARGYAPLPIATIPSEQPTLSMGGDLKAVFALQSGKYVYLSQHTGDLADASMQACRENLQTHLSNLLGIIPERVVCDLHPAYLSRRAAEQSGLDLTLVQHHHAHIASVMAEHRLHRVIGFAFDGTGYGSDGTVWGGELLFCEEAAFERVGHLLPLPMPAGDEGAKDTLRLSRFFLAGVGVPPQTPEDQLIYAAVQAKIGIPTSSMGRLFDAVAAILGICFENTYEGRAATLLENAATLWDESGSSPYPLSLPCQCDGAGEIWRSDRLLQAVWEAKRNGTPVGAVALGFHHAIADCVRETALRAAQRYQCADVALSGGVFANRLLLRLCRQKLESAGLSVYRNEKVPSGDGGIALGQAYIAALSRS